ncbi:MAG: CPBP family intramembrane glutamic endopeptidase [Candidatus Acidiferrales bacterium]
MNPRALRWFTLADVTLLPLLVLWFIWQLQFTARWTWLLLLAWILASFLLHRDTPKTLGWRADNLWPATKQALIIFAAMSAGLGLIGLALGAPREFPEHLIHWRRLEGYFAFCVLQQVALNSLFQNRMLALFHDDQPGPRESSAAREWAASLLTGALFAACHLPNPVLVPLTFIGGAVMAWMFARQRNIIPLAIGQAILGSLIFWAFPVAWHLHLRVGPGYFHWPH